MVRFNLLSPKKDGKRSNSAPQVPATPDIPDAAPLSPELVPIVTLLTAQNHRRYYEGVFMFYYDLGTDGKSGDRVWKEVYGILTGNQLAYWDAKDLALCRDMPEKLLETSCRPQYLNFSDAVFNAMAVLPTAKLQLENVIVVLTTLKNRFIIQLRTQAQLQEMLVALRLSAYEYQALQEAYTGALLSARGLQLSDIRTILTATRYDHAEWVKIRYGSGTAWKRCYMVIQPLTSKKLKKGLVFGRVLIYENDTCKKKDMIGEISAVTSLCAVYPQLHFFIDKSTMMKLEGKINFRQGGSSRLKRGSSEPLENDASLFIMPEEHQSVPGYDTLIRFLVPLMDAFGQYGRPKRLKADRMDPESLLFGLPTLPCVHYLEVQDLLGGMPSSQYIEWDAPQWRSYIKNVLSRKLAQGYNGCGSARSLHLQGQISGGSTPRIMSPLTGRFPTALSPSPTNSDLKAIASDRKASLGASPATSSGLNPGAFSSAGEHKLPSVPSKQGGYPMTGSPSKTPRNGAMPGMAVAGAATGAAIGAAASHGQAPRRKNDLAEIYQNYTKLQAPTDQFNDRNKILNGSEEEIDETKLPTLMRKKSLMHGPYPTKDKFIGESEDELDESEEESEYSDEDDSYQESYSPRGEERLNSRSPERPSAQFLAPKQYEERNLSYSSVQSPNTQYQEFNKQFSKSFKNPMQDSVNLNNSDYGSDNERDAPLPPAHGSNSAARKLSYPLIETRSQGVQQSYPSIQHQPPTPSLDERRGSDASGGYKPGPSHEVKQGPPLTPAEERFTQGPKHIRPPNQQQQSHQYQQQNQYPLNSPNNQSSMQSMHNKFQNTSIDTRGYEQQMAPQGNPYGRSQYLQGPSASLPTGPGPNGQQSYNMQYQQQRPAYQAQHPQPGSPQQRGQYMQQRPPQQNQSLPPRPQQGLHGQGGFQQGYGAPSHAQPHGQYGSPGYGPPPNGQSYGPGPNGPGPNSQKGGYRPAPNQYQYGHGANPGVQIPNRPQQAPAPMQQARPGYGGQYPSQSSNTLNHGQPPRPNPYAQQSSLSMRSDDQEQYQYQVNPNMAPRRKPNQGAYPGPGEGPYGLGSNSRYQ